MRICILITVFCTIVLANFTCKAQLLFSKICRQDADSFNPTPWGYSIIDIDKDTMKLNALGSSGYPGYMKSFIYNIYNDSTMKLINRLDGTIGTVEYYPVVNSFKRINDTLCVLAVSSNRHYNNANNAYDTVLSGLIYFNNQGDSLYSRWFGMTNRIILSNFERIGNNLFLLCTTKVIGDGRKVYVVKTDLLGNVIWEKLLTQYTNSYCTPGSIIQIGNNGYIISGIFNSNANGNNGGLYRIDSNGNILWYRNLYPGAHGGCYQLTKDINGAIYLAGAMDTIINATDYYYNGFISKIDTQGNFLWKKVFNETPQILKNIWMYRTLSNGDMIFCGEHLLQIGSNRHVGWICRTDSYGNIKWEQDYQQNDSSNYNVLSNIEAMQDGGFIATGTCKDSTTKKYGIWLIRVDSNGCLLPGCFPTSIQILPEDKMQIAIYPNPSIGNFTIEYSKPLPKNGTVKVFDITGKTVFTQHEKQGAYKTLFNLKAAQGLYILQIISDKGEQMHSQKIQLE